MPDSQQSSTPILSESTSSDKSSAGLSKGSLIASIFTGIAASTCCIGPLVLLALGISGTWISNLSALEPVRPLFIGLTLVFLGMAFRKLYLVPQSCAVDAPCATPTSLRNQRIIFWIVAIAILAIVAFPWYGPILLDD